MMLWDLIEVLGFTLVVLFVFLQFGPAWGLLALGAALVVIANARGR